MSWKWSLAIAVAITLVAFAFALRRALAFSRVLPRLSELKATMAEPDHPDSFFRNWEASLRAIPAKLTAFKALEASLAVLDDAAWKDLKDRAAPLLISRARATGRGWQALFDVFNEAKAYGYLVDEGCADVRFLPRATQKTPDLEGWCRGQRVLCEVKTLNISDEEANRRKRSAQGHMEAFRVATQFTPEFLQGKLRNTLTRAVEQLASEDPDAGADRVVFAVLHIDDSVGDYLPEFVGQVDQYLQGNTVQGARLVLCVTDLFGRTISMKSAIVVQGSR